MKRMTVSSLICRSWLAMTGALLLTVLGVTPLRAQVDAGAILGTVTDASGSAVHGATTLSGAFAAGEITAHVPGTNATGAVGQAVTSGPGGVAPGKPIIEFNNTGIPGI